MKWGIKFNLPFRLMDEDRFQFRFKDTEVKAEIKLLQNFEGAKKIMGMEISTSGEGAKVDMNADYYGLVNYTGVRMELTDDRSNTTGFNDQMFLDIESGFKFDYSMKVTCMQILNIIVKTVRHVTNNYLVRYVSLRDIVNFQIFNLSVSPPQVCISMNPGHGYAFPNFKILSQYQEKSEINRILNEGRIIPIWKNLFLDSINYFTMSRYNESVVTVNIALESFVATHLYNKLNLKSPDNGQENREEILKLPKSLHEVMRKKFPKYDGRNFEAQNRLWRIFDTIREYRTKAVHSFTMGLDEKIANDTIHSTREIIKWIDPSVEI